MNEPPWSYVGWAILVAMIVLPIVITIAGYCVGLQRNRYVDHFERRRDERAGDLKPPRP